MARKLDPLSFHFQDTTASVGVSRKVANMRTTTLCVLGAFAIGILIAVAQMHQRDKVDAVAAKEGKIPAITISTK